MGDARILAYSIHQSLQFGAVLLNEVMTLDTPNVPNLPQKVGLTTVSFFSGIIPIADARDKLERTVRVSYPLNFLVSFQEWANVKMLQKPPDLDFSSAL